LRRPNRGETFRPRDPPRPKECHEIARPARPRRRARPLLRRRRCARESRRAPSPGAAEIGDRLFPGLGNGGYDALHYHLDLRYATSDPAQPIDGKARILARATQSLSSFNLDFAGDSVGAVHVNGRVADWTRAGEELVVTPRRPLRKGHPFVITVSNFVSTPTVPNPDDPATTGFFVTPDGSATAPQPDKAHRIFPSNDHPRDKASFTFRFDVPAGRDAVANGVRAGPQHARRAQHLDLSPAPAAGDVARPARGRGLGVHIARPPSRGAIP
jgi:hypothetical protein